MIRVFLNCLAASAGGGLTYLRNVVPHLSRRPGVHTTVAAGRFPRNELEASPNITLLEIEAPQSATRRFLWEQTALPKLIASAGADVLISTGNFALHRSPVPQILLSRNALYCSADFFRDLRARREYFIWLDTRLRGVLAKRSIGWADRTVAPSRAFAQELQRWTGKTITAIHHGFDREPFFGDQSPLPPEIRQQLDSAHNAVRLLFVSHYNYYRNFETVFRALAIVRARLPHTRVLLFLTCKLNSKDNPGAYQAEPAAALVRQLGLSDAVIELGAIPYRLLHQVYRGCNIYVTAAYAETFAHPLVEAMASGLPVIASDLAVHREICGAAACYFPAFSETELAAQIEKLITQPEAAQSLVREGGKRWQDFSWAGHADEILRLAEELLRERSRRNER